VLCRFADLPNRTVNGQKVAGDIRSYLRSCDTVNRGNFCLKEVNFNRETCYSTCRASYCNTFNGEQDPKEFVGNGTKTSDLNWPNLFNYNAELGGSMTAASGMLVGLGAAAAFVHAWP